LIQSIPSQTTTEVVVFVLPSGHVLIFL